MPPDNPKRPDIKRRVYAVRALDDAEGFDGHAATWWTVDSYGTAMKPGAFKRTLKARGERVPVLWQHDPFSPIGRPTELKEDKTGLAFRAEVVTDTRAGAEAMALLRADVPLGMSFGFETIRSRPIEDGDADKLDWSQAPAFYTEKDGREFVRIIEEVRLWEISLVTFPANDDAGITAVRADSLALSPHLDAIRAALAPAHHGLIHQIVLALDAPGSPDDDQAPTAEARQDESFDLLAAAALSRSRLALAGVMA